MEDDKQGEIKHIYRTWVFLYSRKHSSHGGIFVCKARHLALIGAKTNENHSLGKILFYYFFAFFLVNNNFMLIRIFKFRFING